MAKFRKPISASLRHSIVQGAIRETVSNIQNNNTLDGDYTDVKLLKQTLNEFAKKAIEISLKNPNKKAPNVNRHGWKGRFADSTVDYLKNNGLESLVKVYSKKISTVKNQSRVLRVLRRFSLMKIGSLAGQTARLKSFNLDPNLLIRSEDEVIKEMVKLVKRIKKEDERFKLYVIER